MKNCYNFPGFPGDNAVVYSIRGILSYINIYKLRMSCAFGDEKLCDKCKNAIRIVSKEEINSVLRNDAYTDCIGVGDVTTPKDVLEKRHAFIRSVIASLNTRDREILDPLIERQYAIGYKITTRSGGNKKRKSSKSKRSNRRKKSNRRRHTKRR